jgi:hypothetical protein
MITWEDLVEWANNDPIKLEEAEKLYETLLQLRLYLR